MSPSRLDTDLRDRLHALDRAGLLRDTPTLSHPEPPFANRNGRRVLVFCSNDYLGLAAHPELRAALAAPTAELGATASRLIAGTRPAHHALEARLAAFVEQPAALLFSTGYAANVGALSALIGAEDVAFSDRLNHASVIDGLRLARGATHVYAHADPDDLERLLRRHRGTGAAWIVTDAVFSMDGDLAPLTELRRLADRYGAYLYVDEAHALGVLGAGRGLAIDEDARADVVVGTLGKAFGVAGAFVAGPRSLRTYLENRARSYVFSTAPPLPLLAATDRALDLVRDASQRRARLRRLADQLRAGLRQQGHDVRMDPTPIVPLPVGAPEQAMALERALLERGLYARGIRPPTVPPGTSRLRLVPTAAHRSAHVEALLSAIRDAHEAP